MSVLHISLSFQTEGRSQMIDITDEIQDALEKNHITEGIANIFVVGSTASISTIENDENLYQDMQEVLEKVIPMEKNWKHHQTWGDENGGSHLRATLFGPGICVPVTKGKLKLGTWQKVVLMDFDTTPRNREIIVTCFS
ncbi:secondary thiamine-phosphate synthase enzyme YjbQ [Patescibacteria group bacterium]|nr:secondary thiamine-phosphate synthase enzyme YjbQ [Patescibacteria group bacterium]